MDKFVNESELESSLFTHILTRVSEWKLKEADSSRQRSWGPVDLFMASHFVHANGSLSGEQLHERPCSMAAAICLMHCTAPTRGLFPTSIRVSALALCNSLRS